MYFSGLTCKLHKNDCKYYDPFYIDPCYGHRFCEDYTKEEKNELKEGATHETN